MDDEQLSALLQRAAAWRDDDPDPRTRAELEALVARASDGGEADAEVARLELADRFAGSLQFGTAGLRGALGAGPNRMNRAVVLRAAAGLAAWLRAHVPGTSHAVVGFDARRDSDVFARDTAAVLAAAGATVAVLPRPLPTPVLAFAVRHLGADAGVMVTASHNPPQDNGYKVYLGGRADDGPGCGAQIVPPSDAEIAAEIAAVGSTLDVAMDADGWTTLDDGVLEDYLDAAAAVVLPGGPRDLDVVLTPLHGVGGSTVVAALRRAGFAAPYVVPQQAEPDPAFPTVAFPNPEEPGAVDLALAAARSRWRRSGHRQRSGRRPVRGRRPGPGRAPGAGGCCAATRSAPCSGSTCSRVPHPRTAPSWPARSCPRSCWRGSPRRTASGTRRP